MAQQHRVILRDNIHGISRKKVSKHLGIKIKTEEWFDCCEFLNTEIKKETKNILAATMKTGNANHIKTFNIQNNIDEQYTINFCGISTLRRLFVEFVQDDINVVYIKKKFIDLFKGMLNFLIIKYVKKFFSTRFDINIETENEKICSTLKFNNENISDSQTIFVEI